MKIESKLREEQEKEIKKCKEKIEIYKILLEYQNKSYKILNCGIDDLSRQVAETKTTYPKANDYFKKIGLFHLKHIKDINQKIFALELKISSIKNGFKQTKFGYYKEI